MVTYFADLPMKAGALEEAEIPKRIDT